MSSVGIGGIVDVRHEHTFRTPIRMRRAYYDSDLDNFMTADPDQILGALASHHAHELDQLQRNAWISQIEHLQVALKRTAGHIFFEFAIPRMGKRADVVLLHGGIVFVIEYKVGATTYPAAAREQVLDYALDLKNFHAGTHDLPVVPVFVATEAPEREAAPEWARDEVAQPAFANRDTLRPILETYAAGSRPAIEVEPWANAPYKPTPTIVEAALALYEGHSVDEITRSDAGAINLSRTANSISDRIDAAKQGPHKIAASHFRVG